jgi:hypothetical protein
VELNRQRNALVDELVEIHAKMATTLQPTGSYHILSSNTANIHQPSKSTQILLLLRHLSNSRYFKRSIRIFSLYRQRTSRSFWLRKM